MAIRTEKKTIGGLDFEVTQLAYFDAQRLFTRLLNVAGPALTGLATIAGAAGGRAALATIGDMDAAKLAPMLASLFERLTPDTAEGITREILATARVHHNGKILPLLDVIDTVIGGDFWTGITLQAFALWVHFGNFNSARAALAAAGLTRKASPSSGSNTSTEEKASS